MKKPILTLWLLLLAAFSQASAQYTVSNYADLPDENLDDNIFFPPTLRAAIQNINKHGVAATITFADDYATIKLNSGLPSINPKTLFDGKGLTLEPATGANINIGLQMRGQYSEIRDVVIRNFNGTGLSWHASDGKIERVTCINNNGPGLNLNFAHRNQIGSIDFNGYASNYFYGNTGTGGNGISLLWSNDNVIEYCAIGHDSNNDRKPNSRSGINVSESYRTFIRNNVISGNDWNGIQLYQKNEYSACQIYNNVIGLDRLKAQEIYNGMNGIYIFESKDDLIYDNIVSGNWQTGINVASLSCEYIDISDNIVGTDKTTTNSIPNGNGIRANGLYPTVRNNIISGNWGIGLIINTDGDYRNNIIGLDSSQMQAVPNNAGVSIFGSDILFGDTTQNKPNIISGNHGAGIIISGAGNKNINITSNIIGNNVYHSKVLPNGGSAILMTHSVSYIYIDNNLISASGWHGIEMIRNVVIFLDPNIPPIYQKPANIVIWDNTFGYPGINPDDTARFGGSCIYMWNVDSTWITQNTMYGSNYAGIYIGNDSSKFHNIYGNIIGDYFMNEATNIGTSGIVIDMAKDVQIGGSGTQDHNYISNCRYFGIYTYKAEDIVIYNNAIFGIDYEGIFIDSMSKNIRILENYIGPVDDSDSTLLVWGHGILVRNSTDIEIGDILSEDLANTIQYCRGYGIYALDSAQKIYSFANKFIENGWGGIALDSLPWYYDSGAYNDELDADSGTNGLLNTIDVKTAEAKADSVRIEGYFRGLPNTIYGVEVYLAKKQPDSTKHRTQGKLFLDRFNIVTDEEGVAKIDTSWANAVIENNSANLSIVTMNVHSPDGSSPFSLNGSYKYTYLDIAVKIDTVLSKHDGTGKVTIYSKIYNKGKDIATTVAVRDTVSDFDLLETTISKGTAIIADSTFIGTIPQLAPGDTVTFITKGRLQKFGTHKRTVYALPAEAEMKLENNRDSIQLEITPHEQNVNLSFGWNMISSNVSPVNASMESVFGEITDKTVIVKNNIGQIYFPEFEINDIGNWNIEHGYQVYMNQAETLTVKGFKIDPKNTQLNLKAGWNMISYLRDSALDIEIALEPIVSTDNLIIAKDNFGNVYFPAFGINMIGDMLPGQGYQIYIQSDTILEYPEN